jgi:hypothetical protein
LSKESRRRQRAASQSTPSSGATKPAGASGSATGSASAGATGSRPATAPSTSPTGSVRVGRRERARSYSGKPSFLERNRNLLVGIAIVAVVGLAGIGMFAAASQPVFACSNVWEPTPTPTPAEGSSPQPGYAQPDMGQTHIANGTTVTYTYCPPASGRHNNASGAGPIAPRLYGPEDRVNPQGWIHNLEHGGLVLLYRGDGPGATEEGQAALRSFFDSYPPSPVCGFEAGSSVGPVFARFDEMAWPFAALVWGRVLPLQELDEAAIIEFDASFGERTNPEQFCNPPSASPSTEPSGSAAPSGSPSADPSPSPSASPSTEPSPSAS